MRVIAAALGAVALTCAVSGCALAPFGEETVPPLERAQARITEGAGTANRYGDSVDVIPGNVVQFETLIGDGRTVIVTIPRGPTRMLTASFRLEGSDEVLTSVALGSRSGEPVSLGDPFEFDPGYLGIEHHSTGEQIELRLAAPRLTGTDQGQVRFTFKTEVR